MRRRGFTLIELLIVIAVVGTLLAIAAGSLQRYLQTLRLNESARITANILTEARSRAIRRSEAFSLELTGDRVRIRDADGTMIKEVEVPHRAQVSPQTTVHFTGRGLPDRQYVFRVSTARGSRNVTLLPTGKVVIP